MSEFTEKQQQYIAWLAQTKYERKPATEQLFAAEIGLSDRTLRRWKNSPEFRQAVTVQARQFLNDSLPEIYGALRREAEKGSYSHIKLSLEITGEYIEDKAGSSDEKPFVIKVIYANRDNPNSPESA